MEFEYTTKGMVMVVNEGGERRRLERQASSWCVLKNSFYNTRCVYFSILFTHHFSFSPSSFILRSHCVSLLSVSMI